MEYYLITLRISRGQSTFEWIERRVLLDIIQFTYHYKFPKLLDISNTQLQDKYCLSWSIMAHVDWMNSVQLTNKAPSTLSWHIKRLLESGVIERKHCVSSPDSNRTFKSKCYDVTNRSLVLDVILNFKETFVDHVINNYSEIVDML